MQLKLLIYDTMCDIVISQDTIYNVARHWRWHGCELFMMRFSCPILPPIVNCKMIQHQIIGGSAWRIAASAIMKSRLQIAQMWIKQIQASISSHWKQALHSLAWKLSQDFGRCIGHLQQIDLRPPWLLDPAGAPQSGPTSSRQTTSWSHAEELGQRPVGTKGVLEHQRYWNLGTKNHRAPRQRQSGDLCIKDSPLQKHTQGLRNYHS